MKNVLIIGKNGFVAKSLYEYLLGTGRYDVTAVSMRDLNVLDEAAVKTYLSARFYDVIIDCAVWSPDGADINDHGREVAYDTRMFFNVAKYSGLYGRLIHFGSGAEYDKRYPIVSVTETDFDRWIPENDYGFAKYIINQYIEKSDNIYNLRIFGLYGKYEQYYCKFITGACAKAVCDIPISIRQNVYFDFLYIDDFCRMIDKFLQTDSPRYHSYNIVSGRKIDLISLANMVCDTAKAVDDRDIPIYVCREGLANEYTASNARLIAEIGETELTPYEQSIKYLYDYFRNHKDEIDIGALLYQG